MLIHALAVVLLRTALLGAFHVLVSPAGPLPVRLLGLVLVLFVAFRTLRPLHSFHLLEVVLILRHARPLRVQLLV